MRLRALLAATAALVACAAVFSIPARADVWTWVAGDSTQSHYGVYGTKGVAAPTNQPGSRYACSGVLGSGGSQWLFGGVGYAASGGEGDLNDLWKYDGTAWTWISGASAVNPLPNHGTKGVAAPGNVPGGRHSYSAWSDGAGNLWYFGGLGMAAGGVFSYLNDLWKHDGTNWTWISGSSSGSAPGVYGTRGVPAAANVPGARQGAFAWRDGSGNLWLFGGYGYSASGSGWLNDLWKFDGTNWTWVAGSNQPNAAGTYGTKGVAHAANVPGPRVQASGWVDDSGHLWLLAGEGYDGAASTGFLNDLWRWDGTYWTWMGGSSSANQLGVYGTPGVPGAGNQPGGRYGAATWRASDGSAWIYGGQGCDAASPYRTLGDLWKWDGTYWTFVAGSSVGDVGSNHGSQGVASPAVTPGARFGAAVWFTSADKRLRLFGGYGYSFGLAMGSFGELWSRQLTELLGPDLTVSAMSAPASVSHGCVPIRVTFTVNNLGGSAGASTLGVYLSDDTTITFMDRAVASVAVPALDPLGTHSGYVDVTLLRFAARTMYLGVIADHLGVVDESDEGNNTRFGPLTDLSPLVLSIADVRNDQGRSVRITFVRAARDEVGSETPITQYEAFRRIDADASPGGLRPARAPLAPDGAAIAGWEFAGAVPAHGEDEYSMVVPTLRDSAGGGLGYSAFFVRAATATPTTFFDSCRDSGCSVDNLPPATPAPFAGVPVAGGNALHWGANAELDLAHYRLYRGVEPGFVPGPGNLIAQPADTGYVDAAGAYFYKLSAVDVNGNESGYAAAQITGVIGVEAPAQPRELALGPATPNPTRASVVWQLALPAAARVRADVHDAAGRRVSRIADATLDAGYRPLRWDLRDEGGRQVESGRYYLRVRVGERTLNSALTVVH